jgi:hypothetical protein
MVGGLLVLHRLTVPWDILAHCWLASLLWLIKLIGEKKESREKR